MTTAGKRTCIRMKENNKNEEEKEEGNNRNVVVMVVVVIQWLYYSRSCVEIRVQCGGRCGREGR